MTRAWAKANWRNRAYIGIVNPVLNGESYRGMGRRLAELRRLERMSLEENKNRQWQSLSRLLQHAYDSTPFYRQRLESVGAKPADFQSFDDLQKLPALTRDDIRHNLEGLWSR